MATIIDMDFPQNSPQNSLCLENELKRFRDKLELQALLELQLEDGAFCNIEVNLTSQGF